MEQILSELDRPPFWTLGAVMTSLVLGWIGFPVGFGIYGPGLGLGLAVLGLWLIARFFLAMRRARTTIDPRGTPTALVTEGVFALSRNPCYLGFVLIALGAAFWADAPLGLAVAAALWALLDRRYARPEEAGLAEAFGPAARDWIARVPRWL